MPDERRQTFFGTSGLYRFATDKRLCSRPSQSVRVWRLDKERNGGGPGELSGPLGIGRFEARVGSELLRVGVAKQVLLAGLDAA